MTTNDGRAGSGGGEGQAPAGSDSVRFSRVLMDQLWEYLHIPPHKRNPFQQGLLDDVLKGRPYKDVEAEMLKKDLDEHPAFDRPDTL